MNKLEESNKTLTVELAEKEKVIKNLESEVEKIVKGNGSTTTVQGRNWSLFLQKGTTQQKTTEQDMILMAKIRTESKASTEKENNVIITELKESEGDEADDKENDNHKSAAAILAALSITETGVNKKTYRRRELAKDLEHL